MKMFPFGALLRVAHAIQACRAIDYAIHCAEFCVFEVDGNVSLYFNALCVVGIYNVKASPKVEEIWRTLVTNAMSTHGPYSGSDKLRRKLDRLIKESIHLVSAASYFLLSISGYNSNLFAIFAHPFLGFLLLRCGHKVFPYGPPTCGVPWKCRVGVSASRYVKLVRAINGSLHINVIL